MVALTAFLAHAPGLRIFHGRRLGPRTLRQNALAIALTLLAMIAAYARWRSAIAPVAAWAAGHVAWGAWLAGRVTRGLDQA